MVTPTFIFININIQLDYKGAHIVCIATTIHQEVLHFWNCVNFSLCWRKLSFCPYHRLFDHGSVSPTLPTVLYTLIVFISQVTKVDVQHACGLDKYFLNDKAWILSEKHTGLKEERWIIFVKGKKTLWTSVYVFLLVYTHNSDQTLVPYQIHTKS